MKDCTESADTVFEDMDPETRLAMAPVCVLWPSYASLLFTVGQAFEADTCSSSSVGVMSTSRL